MTAPLRVLIVDDSETDAKLVLRSLQTVGRSIQSERVRDAGSLRAALKQQEWDAIVCDWSMPQFSALGALEIRGTLGKIAVRTCQRGEHVVRSIGDSGVDVPEHVGARIFEPFFTTKGVGKGTGQGPALAWAVVKKKHGGNLWFSSKSGEGTTFFIERRLQASSRPEPELGKVPRSRVSRSTILVNAASSSQPMARSRAIQGSRR